jgi:drug/metabolite transporter (DMT)-like permease
VSTAPIQRPGSSDLTLLAVGVSAVSTSAPIIAACAVPTLAIAFWRNALASGAILPFALARRTTRAELSQAVRGGHPAAGLAAVLLALHFATWIPSLALTSVASAVALVATQPAWSALIARLLDGQRLPRASWVGIWLAILGVAMISGVDVTISGRALLGDLMAFTGAAFAAGYVAAGSVARQRLNTTSYTLLCYSGCGLLLVAACLVGGVRLGGFSRHDWLLLFALTAGAQLLGHSVFNIVLRTTSPTVVSLSILLEVPGAITIAWVFLGQTPRLSVIPGLVVLIAGIGLTVRAGTRQVPLVVEPE